MLFELTESCAASAAAMNCGAEPASSAASSFKLTPADIARSKLRLAFFVAAKSLSQRNTVSYGSSACPLDE